MTRPDHETLMAYADGALDPDKAREVEQLIEGDTESRRIVEAFKRTGRLTRAAFDAPTRGSPPQHLVDLIMKAAAPAKKRLVLRTRPPVSWMALAACVALIAGLGLGVFLARSTGPSVGNAIALGQLPSTDPVSAALTRLTSGATAEISGGTLTMLTTFRDVSQRACREFELTDANAETAHGVGVACRNSDGWRIEAVAQIPVVEQETNGGFSPAQSERRDPLAGFLTAIGASAALSPDEEAALIGGKWDPAVKE